MKRLKLDRKHNDKDDTKIRVDVAFAQGLSQGMRGGREEAEQESRAKIGILKQRVRDLEISNAAMARERNQHRQDLMKAHQDLGQVNTKLDAAVALLKRTQLAIGSIQTTLNLKSYVTKNGVLIHESTARAAENKRTLEDDLDSVLAGAFAGQEGAPTIALTTNIDLHNIARNNHPIRVANVGHRPVLDQTAIAIRGADGRFSHYEYPDEDEALGRDREQWGPPGQEEDPEEGAVRTVRFGTTLGGRFHPSGTPITLTGREVASPVRLLYTVLEDEEADPEEGERRVDYEPRDGDEEWIDEA